MSAAALCVIINDEKQQFNAGEKSIFSKMLDWS